MSDIADTTPTPVQTQKRGSFITLEGGDGSGKSTHVDWLAAQLQQANIDLVQTREPGGTELGEQIRAWLLPVRNQPFSQLAELFLIFAARAQHVERVISPALTAGQWVLCERFTDATYAYQGGGRGLPMADIAYLENMLPPLARPDITLLFDLPPELGIRRKDANATLDQFELESIAFHERVRAVYLARAEADPARIKIIATDRDIQTIREQIKSTLETLSDRIKIF